MATLFLWGGLYSGSNIKFNGRIQFAPTLRITNLGFSFIPR